MVEHQTPRGIKDILAEELEAKGLTTAKLAEQTGIAERHLDALFRGAWSRLPAVPYVRGYLEKIGPLLGLDVQELWKLYRHELNLKTSGPLDRLPTNRYALQSIDRRWIIGGVAGVLLVLYLGFNLNRLRGTPLLVIENPAEDTVTVATDAITLTGAVSVRDTLFVEGREVSVGADGRFEERYPLEPGLNTITFTAKRFLGEEREVVRRVVFEVPLPTPVPVLSPTP